MGAINAAEFMGKQLAGKKAQYAGDTAMHSQTWKFGVMYADPVTDTDLFNKTAGQVRRQVRARRVDPVSSQ